VESSLLLLEGGVAGLGVGGGGDVNGLVARVGLLLRAREGGGD